MRWDEQELIRRTTYKSVIGVSGLTRRGWTKRLRLDNPDEGIVFDATIHRPDWRDCHVKPARLAFLAMTDKGGYPLLTANGAVGETHHTLRKTIYTWGIAERPGWRMT